MSNAAGIMNSKFTSSNFPAASSMSTNGNSSQGSTSTGSESPSVALVSSRLPKEEIKNESEPQNEIERGIGTWIRSAVSQSDVDVMTYVMDRINLECNKPCPNFAKFQERSTKAKGDYFERFVKLYLKAVYSGALNVWLLSEVPENILATCGLRRCDRGIDILVQFTYGLVPVQAKYRSRCKTSKNSRPPVLGWQELSTFYALCARTGPWCGTLIVTTADYAAKEGHKISTDATMAYKTLASTPKEMWLKMAGDEGHKLSDYMTLKPSYEEMQATRLKTLMARMGRECKTA